MLELVCSDFKIVIINILMGLNKKAMCGKKEIYFSTGKHGQKMEILHMKIKLKWTFQMHKFTSRLDT